MTSIDVERVLPAVALSDAFEWAIQAIGGGGTGIADGALCRDAIAMTRERLARARLPNSWIPMDLDPENVLVDDGGTVRFIDLDDSFLGPAPLAIATFARRIGRAGIAADAFSSLRRALYRAYDRAWRHGGVANCPWRSVEIASLVLDAHLGWQRIRRSEEVGEISGAVEFARSRVGRQLAHAISKLQTTMKGGDKP